MKIEIDRLTEAELIDLNNRIVARIARTGFVAVLYFLSARVGLAFVIQPEGLAAVWPPAGVALAALLLTRPREWPLLLAGVFVANGLANLLTGVSVAASLGFAVANCAESLLAAAVLARVLGLPVTLTRLREVVTFTLLAVVGSNAVTSLLGAAVPALAFGASYWDVWRVWLVGDGMGMLVVGAPILTGAAAWSHGRPRWSAVRAVEAVGLLITLGVVGQVAFEVGPEGQDVILLPYAAFAVLIWGAIRFGSAGASACTLLLAGFAVWHTAHGHGFIAHVAWSVPEALLQVQGYVAVVALSALTLAAVVGERGRAQIQATLRRREAEGLAQAASSISESLDVATVTERIVEAVRSLLACDTGLLRGLDPDGSAVLLAGLGPGAQELPAGHRQNRETGMVGRAIAEGRAVWSRDQLNDPRVAFDQELRERVVASGSRAILAVPLRTAERTIGVLLVASRAVRDFSGTDVELAEAFAAQAAVALENARLYQLSEERAARTRALAEVERVLTETLDPDLVARRIVEVLSILLRVPRADVWRLDEATGELRTLASTNARGRLEQLALVLPKGVGAVGLAVRDGRTVVVTDALEEPRIVAATALDAQTESESLRAALAVPLRIRGRTVGALGARDRRGRVFTEEEVRLVEAFADQAALALENARLYAETVESTAEYQGLVEGSIQGISLHQDGIIRLVNPALVRMLGYADAGELVGQPYWITVAPHERARLEGYRTARLHGEPAPTRLEFQAVCKEGSLLWVEVLVSVVRWRGAPAILVTWIDITERKRAEEARAKAEEQLREAQRMEAVGHLTGGVAHHFNNLLTIILGNVELLRRKLGPGRPEIDAHARSAIDATKRGTQLVRRLLAFARRQPLAPRRLDLNFAVAGMSELLRRTVGETIAVDVVPASGLWEIQADSGQVEISLLNLALNARDAMPAGGTLRIETANVVFRDDTPPEVTAGDYVMLAVSDTGLGMSAETIERAFEPFFTTKEVGQETGLGLSMVYGFVRQSGGTAKIESTPGVGTTVRIYLPRSMADATGAGTSVLAAVAPARSQETILVLEDEPSVRHVVVTILTGFGYRVLEAAVGTEALAILRGPERVDLLFSDVVLPGGLSGPEVARQARAVRPTLKVLYTSGYFADSAEIGDKLDAPLLCKPYSHAELERWIRQSLDSDPT